jgi:phytoene dehydrogenase-like protein
MTIEAQPTAPPAASGSNGRKVVIIGGGIAGLSCGCYLQMNGIPSEILEMTALPGGLCTSWDRGPYVFDGCLRWLLGISPPSVFHRIWMELGAFGDRKIMPHDEIVRVESADGRSFSVPADLDRFAAECKRLAPEDSALVDELVRDAKRSAWIEPPIANPLELMKPREKIRLAFEFMPIVPVMLRWKRLPLMDYLARYRNPFLRDVMLALAGEERMSALVLVMVLAFRSRNNTGFVSGGSLAFAQSIADRYTRLGGIFRFNTQVASVEVTNNRATGVQCADGKVIPASAVVSCADGHTTIFKMLGGRYVNRNILKLYEKGDLFPALIQASFGINCAYPDAPQTLTLLLAQPLAVDNKTKHLRLEITVFNSDAGLCPEGKTVMTVRAAADYDFWVKLKQGNPQGYRAEKKSLLKEIVAILDRRFPGLAGRVEHSDLATPATFEDWTGNWQGSYEGWLPTPRTLGRRIPYTLPGLKDFYMGGHWVVLGGGLPSAAISGRYVAQMICARDGKTFAATKA